MTEAGDNGQGLRHFNIHIMEVGLATLLTRASEIPHYIDGSKGSRDQFP